MGKPRLRLLCFPFVKVIDSFQKCPLSRKSLIIGIVCAILVVSQIGYPQRHGRRRTDQDKKRRPRGLDDREMSGPLPVAAGPRSDAELVVPTRSNVVYITLRAKRLKPAHIRGTVRPKVRRKVRSPSLTQSEFGLLDDAGQINGNFAHKTNRKATREADYKSVDMNQEWRTDADSHLSSIRIYSQMAPPWFSALDVETMRFLADARVLRMKEIFRTDTSPLLLFEGETSVSPAAQTRAQGRSVCGSRCGVVLSPVDNAEVFAFHLDRVLALNRTLPAVSRKFRYLHDGQSCPVVSWDASLYPAGLAAGWAPVRLTWAEYQSSLKQKCWYKNVSPKPDSGCSTIHHNEWSKLALFDFLLQIHNRLDQSCCGFRPRHKDVCVQLGRHAKCGDRDQIKLANIIHRVHNPRQLVFMNNKGFFDRNEDNLDFSLLEGIREFPEQAVSVLRSRKLRQKLLQSLFLDQTYWESQGGRQGIDKLIDVIERRANVLLTYINAHGIKIIPMNV
ncbi:Golgi-associated kinase 1B [Pholidichthys leucotaenia]